jgi:pyruvate/2-oxoglutarate/acetoin dehydrogenase E1 component
MKLVLAIREAMRRVLTEREGAVVIGPDVGAFGGVYRATAGLREVFGAERIIDLAHNPLASFGFARGLALAGRPVVCELAREDAAREAGALALDVARWSRLAEATVSAVWGKEPSAARAGSPVGPIVLRVPVAADADLAPWLAAAGPGVHVVPVTTGEDACEAIIGGLCGGASVVVALEPERLYRSETVAPEVLGGGPLEAVAPPSGVRALTEPADGEDLVLLCAGAGVAAAREVAAALGRERYGVAVYELRALAPLEPGQALEALGRCGRVVVHVDGGPLGERLAGRLAAEAFLSLEAPVRAVPTSGEAGALLEACRATLEF